MKQTLKQNLKLFFSPLINLYLFLQDMKVALTNDPYCCYEYASYELKHQKRRSYLVEEVIAKSAEYSKRFAFIGLDKKRFELGESAIATSAVCSYFYARDVLKGRFELGEIVLSTNLDLSICYARDVLKGRFIEAEELISKDPKAAFTYAKLIMNGRFKLGEEAIINSCYIKEYLELVLKELDNKSTTIDIEVSDKDIEQNKLMKQLEDNVLNSFNLSGSDVELSNAFPNIPDTSNNLQFKDLINRLEICRLQLIDLEKELIIINYSEVLKHINHRLMDLILLCKKVITPLDSKLFFNIESTYILTEMLLDKITEKQEHILIKLTSISILSCKLNLAIDEAIAKFNLHILSFKTDNN